jgi:hypothetical protein
MFVKRFLPRDDSIVVGAIRDVIRRAYKEETRGAPYLVNATTARGIRVDGAKNGYIVVPVQEDTARDPFSNDYASCSLKMSHLTKPCS